MNDITASVFLGPIFLIAFFLACTIVVAGIKILYLYLRREPIKLRTRAKKTKKPEPAPPPAPAKPIRSIEINPDEVDKIYVKKIS